MQYACQIATHGISSTYGEETGRGGKICNHDCAWRQNLPGDENLGGAAEPVSSGPTRRYADGMSDETLTREFGADRPELLSVEQMYRVDAAAMSAGIAGETLMENAGRSVARCIGQRWSPRPIAILCGPGNNGGDGFVVARLLAELRWPVTVALLGDLNKLSGDAALNAGRWQGKLISLTSDDLVTMLDGSELVVDALFGAGLTRDLAGAAKAVVDYVNERALPCVAVDVPSGVHGDSGMVMGAAISCRLTVTFCRRKPGHVLLPGRKRCGEIVVADIGIPEDVVKDVVSEFEPVGRANGPHLWQGRYPWPKMEDHKFSRGHALIAGGAVMTGAARLAARGAARIGAGMVTIAAPLQAVSVYAADWPSFLVTPVSDAEEFAVLLEDRRRNAVLVGPGRGVSQTTQEMALAALARGKATVLDADALTVFGESPARLFEAIASNPVVLTPHEGEFGRLFGVVGDKISRCRAAARMSGAVVLLKGPDTVIAAPDGRVVVNDNAPPELATAGAGDVLAGFIVGLMAQGADPFDAACAAAWLHGAAAKAFGPGLVAGDLPDALPNILARIVKRPDGASGVQSGKGSS
jgi:ADP-dependent NAD(P)H-hydrate dehydratase / NAD(P)H-hydrate epimerase